MATPQPLGTSEAPGETTVTAPVLRCRSLRKSFGEVLALDDVSFEVARGETYGLLGPNGAGKTTAISIIAGILRGDGGEVLVDGAPLSTSSVGLKQKIGYVPQDIALYPDLSGAENLRFFGRLYGMGRDESRRRVGEVLETIGLADRAGDLVSTYSGGMKRRLNIGAGLLHDPTLLILDEPTVGVDPQSRNAILDSVALLSRQGMSVLYTTHYMEEAQRLCDRVGIIDSGHLVAEGTTRELTALVGEHDTVRLGVEGDLQRGAEAVRSVAGVHTVTTGAEGLEVLASDARTLLPGLLAALTGVGVAVRSVAVEEPDLEAVFLHVTGKSLRD
jgi:ABC-2 type transport system ATP-binding protein